MQFFELIDRTAKKIETVSGVMLGLMTVLIFLTAMVRYLMPFTLPDGYDISRLLLGISVLWGLAAACCHNEHIKVDIFCSVLSPWARRKVDIFAESLVLCFVVLFAWKLFGTVEKTYLSNEETFDLGLAIWPAYALAWLGVLAAALMALLRLMRLIISGEESDCLRQKEEGSNYYE